MNDNYILYPLVRRSYGLSMIDPPWSFKTYSAKGKGRSAEQHYDCWPLERIFSMPIADLAHPDGMWVWLWATAPMYDAARACFDRWNVKYVTQGVWVKMVKDGSKPAISTGYALRNSHEPFLIGKIGKPKVRARDISSAILEPRREHSRKPEEGYRRAAKMAGPYPKADIFARETRPLWDAWGNEITKFNSASVGEPELKPAIEQIASQAA